MLDTLVRIMEMERVRVASDEGRRGKMASDVGG
jgi:hypothetical protein